ncbi:MAG: hypothetical protein ACM31C_09005 [Acidobacteriota bacterium]
MRKSIWLSCSLALAFATGACSHQQPGPISAQHPTQGTEATLGRTSPTGVEPPPCPGDTQAQVQQDPNNPQPRCSDIKSDPPPPQGTSQRPRAM